MDYSIRELECFMAVAEELSFTRAAKRLNLAQPPLSRHIKTLEEKIGARLFLREPRNVSLTAAGSLFYEETRNIPRRLIRAGEAARRCAIGETARLRLGFVSAVMNDALVEVFREFRERHPQVQIMLHDVPPGEQLKAIADGRLDGGFVGMATPDAAAGIGFFELRKEPLVCLLPSAHAFAGRKSIKLKSLADESFVAVSGESAPAFASHVRELCRAAGFRPRVILESPRAQAVALMVAAGSGVAILPQTLGTMMGSAVSAVAIEGRPKITHVFAHRTSRGEEALRDLIRLLR
ncbi:LysR family transcriptional regulator [Luteolibacter yonseiensis]|uniref:LysR family transcriptional regulator n=1 Tax=Luteolibacter yonseiensis TaxID=1144680 RepID=A0A934R934_9BACT|nr:LysR substrate-binding domain-containing protein [Luteolibacter yonseiensis]MBK1817465.1 LysR family transcriptional regulator [Luteolibacter yonseiensis]